MDPAMGGDASPDTPNEDYYLSHWSRVYREDPSQLDREWHCGYDEALAAVLPFVNRASAGAARRDDAGDDAGAASTSGTTTTMGMETTTSRCPRTTTGSSWTSAAGAHRWATRCGTTFHSATSCSQTSTRASCEPCTNASAQTVTVHGDDDASSKQQSSNTTTHGAMRGGGRPGHACVHINCIRGDR